MNKQHLNSLRIAWPSRETDYPYLETVLRNMGHSPEFPNVPQYVKLWTLTHAARLLGEDATQWESKLESENQRLQKHQPKYEPLLTGTKRTFGKSDPTAESLILSLGTNV
jgi:maltose-binding protein MalE